MNVKGIDHVVLTSGKLEETVKFYTDILGMQMEKGDRLAFKFGNQKINIHRHEAEFLPAAGHPVPGSADLCLLVEGAMEKVYQELLLKGIEPEVNGIVNRTGAMGPIRSIYLRDPDSNLIELSSYAEQT